MKKFFISLEFSIIGAPILLTIKRVEQGSECIQFIIIITQLTCLADVLPRIDELLVCLYGSKVFLKFNLYFGYH